MMNKNDRMEALKQNGYDTSKFFNLNVPVGTQIVINGIPYTINDDEIVKYIMESGYIYNYRTDGRFVASETFRMLTKESRNFITGEKETGWDNYLRNRYSFMYQFTMMLDEVHRLAKMEKSNDPDFAKLSCFFTKDVVYQTCKHYISQLKKFVKNQKPRKCKGVPYVKLNRYGNVFKRDLNEKVYSKLESALAGIKNSIDYTMLENRLRSFMKLMVKLPYETPKCPIWKEAFKGNGAYKTLNNIIKHHGVTVTNYETKEKLDRDESVAYVESLLVTYKGNYWKFHELLKAAIEENNFDLKSSIESQK